jgi:hypothetical protein
LASRLNSVMLIEHEHRAIAYAKRRGTIRIFRYRTLTTGPGKSLEEFNVNQYDELSTNQLLRNRDDLSIIYTYKSEPA